MPHYHRLVIYFDGASKNNPRGPAGCGWVLYEMDDHGTDYNKLASGQKYLGYSVSNNQAEYRGLDAALDYLDRESISCHGLFIRGDSEIVLKQLEGIYKVRSDNIIGYYNNVINSLDYVDKTFVKYTHIDRSRNSEADQNANDAIDEQRDCTW
jgi:ribonuclease HI